MARKFLGLAAAAACMAAFPAAAGADTVRGIGLIGSPANAFSIDASGDAPTTSSGSVQFIDTTNNLLQTFGNVVCMTVSGSEAFIVYQDIVPAANGTVGGYIRVKDNGPAGPGPVDEQNNGRAAQQGIDKQVAAGCPIPTSGSAFHPLHLINTGEIIVS